MSELRESVSVTLDANGYGIANYARGRAGLDWTVIRFASTGSASATLRIYRGMISPGNQVDSTISAEADTSETNLFMYDSDTLWFEWTNGQPGALMSCSIVGRI